MKFYASEINDNISFFVRYSLYNSQVFSKNLHTIKIHPKPFQTLKTCIGTVLCTAAL